MTNQLANRHMSAAADRRISVVVRLVASVTVVVTLGTGVFVLGRMASNAVIAMLLSGLWFGTVLAVAYALVRRKRQLLGPVAVAFAGSVVAASVLLGRPLITDDVVDEDVVTGSVPEAGVVAPPGPGGTRGKPPAPGRNLQLAKGSFVPLAHSGAGTATVVQLASGGRRLTLTEFRTNNGPDLRVYLTTKDPARSGGVGRFRDLGALKGNKGNQQYTIPDDLDLGTYSTVVIWCRTFNVGFTSATLTAG